MVLRCDLVSHFLTEMWDQICWHKKAGIFYLTFSQKMGLMATAASKRSSFPTIYKCFQTQHPLLSDSASTGLITIHSTGNSSTSVTNWYSSSEHYSEQLNCFINEPKDEISPMFLIGNAFRYNQYDTSSVVVTSRLLEVFLPWWPVNIVLFVLHATCLSGKTSVSEQQWYFGDGRGSLRAKKGRKNFWGWSCGKRGIVLLG